MSYSFESRIRFSECDSRAVLTLTALLDYFQDTSAFQGEDLNLGVDYLWTHGTGWLLASWQVGIARLPRLGERVRVETRPYKMKGIIGLRNFEMYTEEGERLAWANSIWLLYDFEKKTPAHIPPEMDAYQIEEKIDMDYCDRKLQIPGELAEKEPIPVTANLIDTNGHVNNGRYVALAQTLLPRDFTVHELRAEYKKQGHLGDIFYPYVSQTSDSFTVVIGDREKDPYAIVAFL